MKITFPHMGNAYISVKVLLDSLGLDYFIPPLRCKKTIEYGLNNSPEFMCLPFKTVIGDFIQGLNNGADVIIFGGGCGQCRLSYFGDLQQKILRSQGYNFKYIHIDLSNITYHEVISKLKPVLQDTSKQAIISGLTKTMWTVFAVDKLYEIANKVRCCEIIKGSTDKIMNKFENSILQEYGFKNIRKSILSYQKALKNIEIDKNRTPLKIAIVGEIFIASDSYTNLEIEKKLGNMGVYVYNTMSPSTWIREHFLHNFLIFKGKDKSIEAAQEFMTTDDIGGHGIYTIGNSILKSKDYDGIIQVYPFTCMPEIIAQSALSEIQRKYETPIMTLILDEMTGEAGYITRLEAFVDMLRMKKENEVSTKKLIPL